MTDVDSTAEEIKLDFDRRRRTGLDEAVFAQGKSAAQIDAIFASAQTRGARLLTTRLSAEKCAALTPRWGAALDYCPVSQTAFFGQPSKTSVQMPAVAVVAGGTSDAPVVREAERTLEFSGIGCRLFIDVGVAGLWRLMQCVDSLAEYPIIIAVAGMDAALPTVLGGLVPGLIIAVPTSVGYGVAAGGSTALNALLASCAPGITVVNIDNGYGAACAAVRALRAMRSLSYAEPDASCQSVIHQLA